VSNAAMASSFFRPNFVPWPFIYRNLTQPDAICRPGRIALPSPTSILFRIVLLVWRTGVNFSSSKAVTTFITSRGYSSEKTISVPPRLV
jgi:hypothetical protein